MGKLYLLSNLFKKRKTIDDFELPLSIVNGESDSSVSLVLGDVEIAKAVICESEQKERTLKITEVIYADEKMLRNKLLKARFEVFVVAGKAEISCMHEDKLEDFDAIELDKLFNEDFDLLFTDNHFSFAKVKPVVIKKRDGPNVMKKFRGIVVKKLCTADFFEVSTMGMSGECIDQDSLEALCVFGHKTMFLEEILSLSQDQALVLDDSFYQPMTLVCGDKICGTGDLCEINGKYALRLKNEKISENYFKNVKLVFEDRTESSALKHDSSNHEDNLFKFLKNADPLALAVVLAGEHYEVIATVISFMEKKQAELFLSLIESDKANEVRSKNSKMRFCSIRALEKVSEILRKKIEDFNDCNIFLPLSNA